MATASEHGHAMPGLRDSAWKQKSMTQKYPPLQEDITADVCVVGAGIAGLSCALALARQGIKVVVLESRVRGGGQTGRTTAHIMTWWDDYYYQLIDMHGADKARLVASSLRSAADWIEEACKTENIDCDFQRVDGFLYANEPTDVKTLTKELSAAHIAGLLDTEMVDLGGAPEVGGITHALRFPNNADFHPLKYVDGLAEAVIRHGGRIFERSRVSQLEERAVMTDAGRLVRCEHIVLATNSPINHNLVVHSRQSAHRSYVVALKVPKAGFRRGDYWSTEQPYHYVRAEDCDADTYHLIIGGEDHPTGSQPEHDPYLALERYARGRWPACKELVLRWTGQVMEPEDQLYLHGRNPEPGHTHTLIITGDSGQGMTGGTIGARVVADIILSEQPHAQPGSNPWIQLYSPSRLLPAKAAPSLLKNEAGVVAASYAERVFPKLTVGYDVAPGAGKVVQTATENKVALYCDATGKKHAMSAVCPHLGCIVHWNMLDQTWDCPCHGSQFSPDGEVINGPANSNLEKLEIDW